MVLGIYKQGQGYWTRMMTFLGGMIMFGWAATWFQGEVQKTNFQAATDGNNPGQFYGNIGFFVVLLIGTFLSYWIAYSKIRTSEFFIATEGEMKKVNWSSKREVIGSTWVVIGVAVLMATVIFLVDLMFSNIFKAVGVLKTG